MQLQNLDDFTYQLKQIPCKKHPPQPYYLLDLSQDAKQRPLCIDCTLPQGSVNQLKNCFDQHYKDFQKTKTVFFMKEMTFLVYIRKILSESESKLQNLIEMIQQQLSCVDKIEQSIRKELDQKEQIFGFQNFEQLEKFADEHYKMYYTEQANFEDQLNNVCLEVYQEINEICDRIFQESNKNFNFINLNFSIIENYVKSKVLQSQINKSIRCSLVDNLINLQNVLFDENSLNVLIATTNILQFLKFESNQKKYVKCSDSIQLDGHLQAICLHKKFEWFVEASIIDGQTQVTFWNIKINQDAKTVITIQQKINNLGLQQIKQLVIDEKNSFCYIFQENQFQILNFNKQWDLIHTFKHQNLIKVQCNSEITLIGIQSQQSSNYLIHIFQNLDKTQLQSPRQIKIANIKEDTQFDYFFITLGQIHYCLIYQNQEISFQQLQIISNKTNLLCKFDVNSGSVFFNQQNLTLSLITNDNTLLIVYKIIKSQNSDQEFEMKILSQISSGIGFSKCFYSQNGKFLVVCENLTQQYQLLIYQMSHLPNLNIAPKKRTLSSFYG